MGKGLGIVLLCALAAAGDDLGGAITSGKARRLADQGAGLMKEADGIFRRWVLDQIPADTLLAELEKAIDLYDRGAAKLQEALDIQEDGGVLHRLSVGAKRLQKLRFEVHFRLKPQVKPKPRPEPVPPGDGGTGEAPEPKPEPKPEPVRARPRPTLDEDEAPGPAIAFAPREPPARPVLVDLGGAIADEHTGKRDRKQIDALVRGYLGARKVRKLTHSCKICKGRGSYRDGSKCEECGGVGERINLYEFRKAYWNTFTPLLREAPGALDALRAFHAHASAELGALGPQVKAFRVTDIEHHGFWAKVVVEIKTTEGESEAAWTVVSIGSNWYFYHPTADADLVPKGG